MIYSILVIEDDPNIIEPIVAFLKMEGYKVEAATDGLEGIQRFQAGSYHLVISDIMLPKIDGYDVCRKIREQSDLPIIMLTALGEEQNQIDGFDLGIDDYIVKPFSLTLLMQRVKALLRRVYETTHSPVYTFKDMTVHLDNYTCHINGRLIELTAKEFAILNKLIEKPKRVVTRETLIEQIWGYDYVDDTVIINTHIKNIRRKIQRPYIKTVTNVGYKLDD